MCKLSKGSTCKKATKKNQLSSTFAFMTVQIFVVFIAAASINPILSESSESEIHKGSLDSYPLLPIRLETSTRSQPEYKDIVSYNDVLVVRNLNSPMSMQIADYFQSKRGIPPINICNITTSTSETVSRTVFDGEIRTSVENHIMNNGLLGAINFIVTTKGVPLRISEVDTSDDGAPFNAWDRACVDSDLALILGPYKNSIGDPYWLNNPIFNPSQYSEFTFQSKGFFLVTRLTGYTWEEIKVLIDRVEDAQGVQGRFVFDVDPGKDGGSYQEGNDWMRNANATLTAGGFEVYLDETITFLTNQVNVSGYTSWGSNDGHFLSNSIQNPGFESDVNGDDVPDDWFFYNDTEVGVCTRNETEFLGGSWSIRMERNATNPYSTYAAQNYTVKPDTRYYATGNANLSGVSTEKGVFLQIRAHDALGNVVAYYNGSIRTGTTTSWISLGQVHFEPISGITNISFYVVFAESSGVVFFDDVRLYEIKPKNDWEPGALAETYVSTGGRSFNYPTDYGQSLVADLIRDGVTGVKGYVYEPYLSACAHPDIIFDAYTQGYNLAESFYMASAFLSWMDVVVGDPKLSPYDRDIIPDLGIISQNITYSDETPQEGQVIDVYAVIENSGPSLAKDVEVEFWVGEVGNGTYLGKQILDVEGWGSNVTSVTWDTNGYLYRHNISVVIDPGNLIFESNEANNNASRTITVNTGYPVADAGPDGVINEDSLYQFDGSGSWDNTSIANYTWDMGDGNFEYGPTPTHTYMTSGIFTVILNVTNVFGLWGHDMVNVTVTNIVPTASANEDTQGFEGEVIFFDGSLSTDTPSDIGTLNYSWNFGDGNLGYGITPSHSYDDDGNYSVILEVRDDDGAIDTDSVTVTLQNVPPQITQIATQHVLEDDLFSIQIEALDAKGDTLMYYDNSSLFEIDPLIGLISFVPENKDVGYYLINITVSDDDGGAGYMVFPLFIENTNDPPKIVSSPSFDAIEGVLYEYQIAVVDDDLNISVGELIYYFLDECPAGMSVDTAGWVIWLPDESDVSKTFTIIVKVSDGDVIDSQIYQLNVSNVNDLPRVLSTPKTSAYEDTFYRYDVDAEDDDVGDTLTYSLESTPEGMTINAFTGEISWLPTNSDVGVVNVRIKIEDSTGAYSVQEFELVVYNTNDAPVLEPVGVLSATEDELFGFQFLATDVDVGDSLSFYVDSGLFKIDIKTGEVSFVPKNEDVGVYNITITVRDQQGAMDYETIQFTVENVNDPPVLDFIGIKYLSEDEPFLYFLFATDPDANDTLTFHDNTTLFETDPLTGEIAFTPTNDQVGRHVICFYVTDSAGANYSQSVIFIIQNTNDPPKINSEELPPPDETIKLEEGSPFLLKIQVSDQDSNETFKFSDDTDLFDINTKTGEIAFTPDSKDAGLHKVKITVKDSKGESDYIYLTLDIEGKEEEGINRIILVPAIASIFIAVILLFLFLKRRKGKSKKEVMPPDSEKSQAQGFSGSGEFPPPPPLPPPSRPLH